jgi:hypothetical protein
MDTDNRNQHLAIDVSYGPRDPTGINDPRNRVFDTWHPDLDGDGDPSNDLPPPFQPIERDASGSPIPDPTTGNPIPKRLLAIQITIRYLDISSNQLRQLTLQISLLD